MRRKLYQHIEIPEGVEVQIQDTEIKIKGKEGEVVKKFDLGKVSLTKKDNEIIVGNDNATKVEKKMMNTVTAHIKNMIQGVQQKFEYVLKVCSSHFPMTVKIENGKAIVKNYLGEKIDRTTKIPAGAEVEINKDIITIKSINKEVAGQAAANLESVTRISNRDRRIFQDGIYIINKAGAEI